MVLLGLPNPVVLRPALQDATSTRSYHIIGRSICHGVMDGEMLLGALPGQWRLIINRLTFSNTYTAVVNIDTKEVRAEDVRLGGGKR